MTTTLVFGASGNVGSALVPLLRAQGQTVLRATSKPATQAGDVHVNLATGEGLARALTGVDQAFLEDGGPVEFGGARREGGDKDGEKAEEAHGRV